MAIFVSLVCVFGTHLTEPLSPVALIL